MRILTEHTSAELAVKNSRFLAELFPCADQAEARSLVKSQKTKYADATHVVHAFVLGLNAEILGMSDDGEPGGTAGRPALDVLKGSGISNLVLTVTRWFGGTLLGTGGLVKAYGDSAKAVLAAAEEQGFVQEYVEKRDFCFSCDYTFYQTARHLFESFDVSDVHEEFGEAVRVSGKIPSAQLDELAARVTDASNGRVSL